MLPSKAYLFYFNCQFRRIDAIKNDVDDNDHKKINQKVTSCRFWARAAR